MLPHSTENASLHSTGWLARSTVTKVDGWRTVGSGGPNSASCAGTGIGRATAQSCAHRANQQSLSSAWHATYRGGRGDGGRGRVHAGLLSQAGVDVGSGGGTGGGSGALLPEDSGLTLLYGSCCAAGSPRHAAPARLLMLRASLGKRTPSQAAVPAA